MKYEVIETEFDKFIKRTHDDGKVWLIPFDEANSDYQEYLASLEEPNLPEVKETPETPEAE
jgi:hypothetical protein